ncbi:MAG: ribosomal protein S18-alanine N-acetyltransferase [Terriglobia bacterium]
MNLIIRKFVEGDVDQVWAIEKAVFPSPWSRRLFLGELDSPHSLLLVADTESEIIGYSGLWRLFDMGHITNLAVEPGHRRRGLGSLLLAKIMLEAVSTGVHRISLEVRRSNSPAIRLYENFGFELVGTRNNYYPETGEDALAFMKEGVGLDAGRELEGLATKLTSDFLGERTDGADG